MIQSPSASRDQLGFRECLAIGFAILATGALATLSLPAPEGGAPFAVVFPPWTSAGEAADRSLSAGLRVLRAGAVPFVAIVVGQDGMRSVAAPRSALFLIPVSSLAGCGQSPSSRLDA